MKLYNTLTRQKEEFKPIGRTVTMYSCGPTVYNYAHIGNLRSYIFMDLLRRGLAYSGYKIKGVLNITDVGHLLSDADEGDDKMAVAAAREKKTPEQIADYYTDVFFTDLSRLNIAKPEIIAKATQHITEMINYAKVLLDKGYAYETDDGIYFDISTFSGYGKLSGAKLDDNIAGARVEINSNKKNAADFALIKKAEKNHIMQWPSPWGQIYPGWHIECSAMAKKYLGATFDIHTGGVDHIPIHHENEIAQSECFEDKKTVNYWLHGEFLQVDGGKMSKSLNNVYTIDTLINKGFSPLDYRYFCLLAHYRKKLNFTFDSLTAAKTARARLIQELSLHKQSSFSDANAVSTFVARFNDAITDDLNVPLALGVLWEMLKLPPNNAVYSNSLLFDNIFGINIKSEVDSFIDAQNKKNAAALVVPDIVNDLLQQRSIARASKNWALSDKLRNEIAALGFSVIDDKDSQQVLPRGQF